MRVVAKSDLSTGNNVFASYVLQSNDLVRSAGTASYPNLRVFASTRLFPPRLPGKRTCLPPQ